MGLTFSNLHIRKVEGMSDQSVTDAISAAMQGIGYILTEDQENADGTLFICAPEDSCWISLCSDLIELESPKDVRQIAKPLSSSLCTDILAISCVDSDFLFLNLINENDQTDAWINVGRPYDDKLPRRIGFHAWAKKVRDLDTFKDAMKEEYAFAEDALGQLQESMALSKKQSLFTAEETEEAVTQLYFALPEGETKAPLKFQQHQKIGNFYPGLYTEITVYNLGDASTGLAILFWGTYDFVEHDEITFSNVCLIYKKREIPIQLTKCTLEDGNHAFIWQDKHLHIPPRPANIIDCRISETLCLGVSFVPHGNARRFLDIRVNLIPLKYAKKGQCSIYEWCWYHSKEEYIAAYNQRAAESARHWSSRDPAFAKIATRPFPEGGGYMNPDDYDL